VAGICDEGWRQGSTVGPELLREFVASVRVEIAVGDQDLGVVLSHDCDLCKDPTGEPWVEFLVVHRRTDPVDGAVARMRSPRVIDFEGSLDGTAFVGRALARDRFLVPKSTLVGLMPGPMLFASPDGLLPLWISRRYIRTAFPDAFNHRWQGVKAEIRRQLRRYGRYLDAIYLDLDDAELEPEQTYGVIARGTMLVEEFGVPAKREEAQRALDGAVARLDGCDGIEVLESYLVSEDEISLAEVRRLRRWDFEDVSLAEE
jgi:hypothetical protein